MKFLTSALIFAALATTGIRHASSNDDLVGLSIARITLHAASGWLLSIKGVTGIDLIICSHVASHYESDMSLRFCINIETKTEEDHQNIRTLFPPGLELNGLPVRVDIARSDCVYKF